MKKKTIAEAYEEYKDRVQESVSARYGYPEYIVRHEMESAEQSMKVGNNVSLSVSINEGDLLRPIDTFVACRATDGYVAYTPAVYLYVWKINASNNNIIVPLKPKDIMQEDMKCILLIYPCEGDHRELDLSNFRTVFIVDNIQTLVTIVSNCIYIDNIPEA